MNDFLIAIAFIVSYLLGVFITGIIYARYGEVDVEKEADLAFLGLQALTWPFSLCIFILLVACTLIGKLLKDSHDQVDLMIWNARRRRK